MLDIVRRLSHTFHARIDIFDLKGKLINTVANSKYDAGSHFVNLNFVDRASGVYIYRLSTENMTTTKKLVYLK